MYPPIYLTHFLVLLFLLSYYEPPNTGFPAAWPQLFLSSLRGAVESLLRHSFVWPSPNLDVKCEGVVFVQTGITVYKQKLSVFE